MAAGAFDLTGRVAVVMGGTSGIGRVLALALALADAGADVVAAGRREELVNEVAAEIEKLGRRTLRLAADATPRAESFAIARMATPYLAAVEEAGRIYRHIASRKGAGAFVAEVSMDETDSPQTPPELLVILAAIADEKFRFRPSRPSSRDASTRPDFAETGGRTVT